MNRRVQTRQGAAVVELAVCLPLIVLLVFGSLEGANMLFVRQASVQAAYESAKAASTRNASTLYSRTIGEQVLAARNLSAGTLDFLPAKVGDLPAGTPIVVTVRVPGAARSIIGFGPFQGITIEASATMIKE